MANREELLDVELFDRIDHPRGISRLPPATPAFCNQSSGFFLTAGSVRSNTRRSDHIQHAGGEAEQQEHDESERRRRQQTVEPPANQRSDNNARDQLRRKLETARHRRASGSAVFASGSGLVSPDFSAVPNFGQPVIQTSEPCGKSSLVGGRLIAASISAFLRAFSHAVETRNDAAVVEITPRHPQKPRGPY